MKFILLMRMFVSNIFAYKHTINIEEKTDKIYTHYFILSKNRNDK